MCSPQSPQPARGNFAHSHTRAHTHARPAAAAPTHFSAAAAANLATHPGAPLGGTKGVRHFPRRHSRGTLYIYSATNEAAARRPAEREREAGAKNEEEEIIIPIIVTDGEPEQLGKTNLPTNAAQSDVHALSVAQSLRLSRIHSHSSSSRASLSFQNCQLLSRLNYEYILDRFQLFSFSRVLYRVFRE